jgi:hypothetical protein
MRTMITMLYMAAGSGVSAVMEHPATAWHEADTPSSWLLCEIKRLRRHPGVQMLRIDQCCFGRRVRKPTQFLTAWLPELQDLLAAVPGQGKCFHHGHTAAIGRYSDGSFRTNELKTYTPSLCAWLASAFYARWHSITRDVSDSTDGPPAEIEQLYAPLDPYNCQQRGRDYALRKRRRRTAVQWIVEGGAEPDSDDDWC